MAVICHEQGLVTRHSRYLPVRAYRGEQQRPDVYLDHGCDRRYGQWRALGSRLALRFECYLHHCAYQLTSTAGSPSSTAIYFGDTTGDLWLNNYSPDHGSGFDYHSATTPLRESDMGNPALCWPNRINGDTVLQTAAGRPPCLPAMWRHAPFSKLQDLLVCLRQIP